MFELGLSLEEAQKMTWGEFQLRTFGYRRAQENDWRKYRKVAYYSAVGSHLNHKKLPKNEVKFMPIGDELVINTVTEDHKEKFLDAWGKYLEKAKNKA